MARESNSLVLHFLCKNVVLSAARNAVALGGLCVVGSGSVAGSRGRAGQTVYSASKAGVAGFTRALAREVASRGVTANVIAPGQIVVGVAPPIFADKIVGHRLILVVLSTGYIETDMTRAAASPPPVDQIPVGRVGTPQEVAELALFLTRAPYITGQVLNLCWPSSVHVARRASCGYLTGVGCTRVY